MAKELTLKAVDSKAKAAADKVLKLEKEVRSLKDTLNVHNNWHSETREWAGERVALQCRSGSEHTGRFLWADRYNLCIDLDNSGGRRIFTKGGVDWIARS